MNDRKSKGLTNLNSDEKIIRETCVSLARMYFSQFAAISCSLSVQCMILKRQSVCDMSLHCLTEQ